MTKICLLLKTKDNKKFLTHEKNLPSLIEFAKTFRAEIYRVEVEDQKTLELKALVDAICDQEYEITPKHNKLEKLFPVPKKARKDILADAVKIRSHIFRKLKSGKPVSLKELKKKYQKHKVTDACLCNHLSMARKQLTREGCTVKKLGAGTYCVED